MLYAYLSTGNEWTFKGPDGEIRVRVNGNFKANNGHAIREAVMANAGIAIAPDWLIHDKVERVEKWPATFDKFQRAERGILIDDRVKRLADDLAGTSGPAGDLAAIMDWVQANLTYDHSATSLVATAHVMGTRVATRSSALRAETGSPGRSRAGR